MGVSESVQSQSYLIVVLVHTCWMDQHPQMEVASHCHVETTPKFALMISHPLRDLVEYVLGLCRVESGGSRIYYWTSTSSRIEVRTDPPYLPSGT